MSDDYRDIVITDSKKRLVEGFANVAVLDRQGDIVPTSAMASAMLDYMARNGPILLGHANKPVGKVLQWSIKKPEGSSAEGIHIIAMIDTGTGVADDAWKGLQEKTITGFSIGGQAGSTQNVRDKGAVGGVARELKEIELNEISLVQIPANQLATVENISVAKSCDTGGCDTDDDGRPILATKKELQKMVDERVRTVTKELHKGPMDTKEEADRAAQRLKQEGSVVYRVVEQGGKWYVDYGFPTNPANGEAPREQQHPAPKKGPYQSVLMAMKGVEGVRAMGLAWEDSFVAAEKTAVQIRDSGFEVYEVVPDGTEWRVDYGVMKDDTKCPGCGRIFSGEGKTSLGNRVCTACGSSESEEKAGIGANEGQCFLCSHKAHNLGNGKCGKCDCSLGEEKAEDAPQGVTVKAEPNGNYDQTKYGNQVDGGLVKGGNESVRRKYGFEYAGAKVRSVGPNGERGTWHRMTDTEREQVRLFGAGELAAATNVPSGFQPAQPIPGKGMMKTACESCGEPADHQMGGKHFCPEHGGEEKDAVSTGAAGVENARYSPEQEEKAAEPPYCCAGHATPEQLADWKRQHPEQFEECMKDVEVEKPFKSRAQQRWMFWQHPKMAREWAGKTDFSSLPEHASKKDAVGDDDEVGRPENDSHAVTGSEAFEERTEGPQGDKYGGEFGEKGAVKQFDAELQPRQMEPGYQPGEEGATGKPVMHEMPADSCDMCGKAGTTRRGVCEACEEDSVNESRAKKGLKKAEKKPYCSVCGDDLRTCPHGKKEVGKEPKVPEDDANVGPNGLAGETALQSGLVEKDTGRSGRCIQCGAPSDWYTEDSERPICSKCSDAKTTRPKSVSKSRRLMLALAGVEKFGEGGNHRVVGDAARGYGVADESGKITRFDSKSEAEEYAHDKNFGLKSLEKSGACRRCGTKRKTLYKRQRGVLCGKCIKSIRARALKTLAGVKR